MTVQKKKMMAIKTIEESEIMIQSQVMKCQKRMITKNKKKIKKNKKKLPQKFNKKINRGLKSLRNLKGKLKIVCINR